MIDIKVQGAENNSCERRFNQMVYVGRMPGREKSCWQIKYTRRHYLIRLLMDEDNLIIAQKEYLLDLTL